MAVTTTKGTYKWYLLHRNHIISIYLLLVYLSITVIVLHDFKPVFYLVPTVLTVLLVRVAWDQSSSGGGGGGALSALAVFLVGFIVVSFGMAAFQTHQQRSLQMMYNYEQFKNITRMNPRIDKYRNNDAFVYNMFFVETNPNREKFSTKQLCAIESAAKNNRNAHVFVLSIHSQLEDDLRKLTDVYPNLILMKFMPIELFAETPLASWWQSGRVFKSKYMMSHITDAARLALLWKYGGVYSDLDTITVKSFEPLVVDRRADGVGYIYENNVDSVGGGVMVFRRQHRFVMAAMQALAVSYDPYDWGFNGPLLIINTMRRYCDVDSVGVLVANASLCNFTIFPENYFYPLRYFDGEYKVLFEPDRLVDVRKLTDAYSVHYYGFLSKDMKVSTRENTMFRYLASCNCELTYRHVDSKRLLFE